MADDGKSFTGLDAYDIGRPTRGQTDLPQLRAGGVQASIFTVAILDEADRAAGVRASTGLFRALARRYPRILEVVERGAAQARR